MKAKPESSAEANSLRELQKFFSEFVRPFEEIRRLKASTSGLANKLANLADKLPTAEVATRASDELRSKAQRLAQEMRKTQRNAFGALVAAFVRECKEQSAVRETSGGWRIGKFVFETKEDQAQVRVLYNHEQVVPWTDVAKDEDLAKIRKEAESRIAKVEVPENMLVEVFWRAYRYVRIERKQASQSRFEAVPLRDFYAETRAALVRAEIRAGKPDKKLNWPEFPRWAFLYNLDRYFALGSKVPTDQRLRPETGSQAEQARGMGMTVGGLDPKQDYKTFCYIVPSQPSGNS